LILVILVALLQVASSDENESRLDESVVRQGSNVIVSFRAAVVGDHLVVRATHAEGWHTYAMDNELRAQESLRGKASLGVEQGIEVRVDRGLQLAGPWMQTEPRDLSKPELRWFTYGFEKSAYFVSRIKHVESDEIVLRVRGQACSGETCKQIDLEIHVPAKADHDDLLGEPLPDLLKRLIPVRVTDVEGSPLKSDS
jgi:hypothetical protein